MIPRATPRRVGKLQAQRAAVRAARITGQHLHVAERGRTVCPNGICPDLPTTTTDEENHR